jgi:hypothetical protein
MQEDPARSLIMFLRIEMAMFIKKTKPEIFSKTKAATTGANLHNLQPTTGCPAPWTSVTVAPAKQKITTR